MSKKEKNDLKEIEELWEKIKPYLTREAVDRLSNLKIAHTEKWLNAIIILSQYINRMILSGKFTKIDENQLKILLSKLFEDEKRNTKIRFIR
ncbi:MAG: DNA-binding protein [Nanopusillaceae archaeon]